jgi:16S rRNA C967 or C1407 C5-methylase (RsmB/RsmF family)
LPQIVIKYNRSQIANYGLNIEDINHIVSTAFAGGNAGVVFENERKFDLMLRLDSTHRNNIDDVSHLYIPTTNGTQIPLSQVAEIKMELGPAQISREDGKRSIVVGFNIKGRDVASVVSDIQKELAQAGIASEPTPYSPWGLRLQGKPALQKTDAFTRGAIEVQDEGSQLLALLVDAKRGEMVADFCAGAGGKTLALGASMRNTGRLYAFDTSAHRLDALKPRLARSGLSNIHPVAIAHERDERIKRLRGKMDRVLVDSPCTGLGTLRRNPDLKWRQTPEAVAELSVKQTAILASAARLLKPGGRLVYATCSLLPEENEQIAQAFSVAHPNFKPLPVKDLLTELDVDQASTLCTADDLYLRLWPHCHATDGFFAAAWVAA